MHAYFIIIKLRIMNTIAIVLIWDNILTRAYTVAESYDDSKYFYHFQEGRMLKGLEASPRPLKSPWQLVKYCIIRGTRSSGLRAPAYRKRSPMSVRL